MKGFLKVLDLLMGNNLRSRGERRSARLPERKRGLLGMRQFRLEPLEERTLLSFSAGIEQAPLVALTTGPFADLSQKDPTNGSPIVYEVTFGNAITATSFKTTEGDISFANSKNHSGAALSSSEMAALLANTTITPVSPADNVHFVVTVNVGGIAGAHDWDVQASIPADSVRDAALNLNSASTSVDNVVRFDNKVPTVTINQKAGQADPTGVSPILFTAEFSETVTGFADLTDVTLGAEAVAAGATVASIVQTDVDGKVYEITVNGLTKDALVTATIGAGVAKDLAGNDNVASTSTDNEVGFNLPFNLTLGQADGTLDPTHNQADPTNNRTIHFSAVFSEPVLVSSFVPSDVTLTFGGGASGSPTAVTPVAGTDNKIWDITVQMTEGQNGTVTASITTDKVQNTIGENINVVTAGDCTVTYNTAVPTVPSVTIGRASGQAASVVGTDNLPIKFTATFSEKVTDFDDLGDVTVSAGTVTKITPMDGTAGMVYEIEVGGLVADATVTATIAAGVAVDTDTVPNANIASTVTSIGIDTVEFNIPLTVKVEKAATQAALTNASPIAFTAQFSEPIDVATFTVSDITLTGTATGATVTPGSIVDLGGNLYSFTVTIAAGTGHDGTVIAGISAGMVKDASGELNTVLTSTDNTVTYDTTKPTVTVDQADSQADPVGNYYDPITFTSYPAKVDYVAVFSEDVTGITAGSLTLGQLAGGTLAGMTASYVESVDKIDARTYLFHVTGFGAGQHGVLTASILADAVLDLAGNKNVVSTSTDNQVTVDTNDVTATVARAVGQASPTSVSPVNFTVTFNTAVEGFDNSDIYVNCGVGTAFNAVWASAANFVVTDSGDHTVYNVAAINMPNDGNIALSVRANSVIDPVYGHTNPAVSTSATVYYNRPLTVKVEQDSVQTADPTNASPIHFTVQASEPLADLTAAKILFAGSTVPGTLAATVTAPTAMDSETNTYNYDIAVTGMTGDGVVIANIGTVHNGGWQIASVLASADNQVTYTLAPTVTINQAAGQADPTSAGPVNFTVVFSQAMTDFTAADVTVEHGAGTAFEIRNTYGSIVREVTPAVVVTDSGDHKTYNVAISGMIADGIVTAAIQSGVAHNSVGTANRLSESTDNSVTYDVPLAVTINQASGQSDPTNISEVHFTAVFNEPVYNFSTASVLLTTTTGATVTAVTGNDWDFMTYDVVVSGMTSSGTITATVPAAMVSDDSHQTNLASTSTDNTVTIDAAGPTVAITPPAALVTSGPVSFNVVFSETVTDFTAADVVLGGTAPGTLVATVTGTGAAYVVAVTGMTDDGTVTISVPAGAAIDAATNGNAASTVATGNYDVPPTVAVTAPVGVVTSGAVNFTVVFSETVTDFTAADVVLGGTAPGTLVAEVTGSGASYTVAVTGMTGDGTVTLGVPADKAVDAGSNGNVASNTATANYDVAPSVAVTAPTGVVGAPVSFTVQFSEPVTNFDAADVVLGGTATGTLTAAVIGTGANYTVAVSGMTSEGTVTLSVPAGAAVDAGSNGNTASTTATANYDAPSTVTITAPTDLVTSGTVNFAVQFNKTVTGFTAADVVVGGTAAGTPAAVVTGSGASYTVSVTGLTSDGTVTLAVPAGAAVDAALVGNAASSTATASYKAGPTIYNVKVREAVNNNWVVNTDEPLRIVWWVASWYKLTSQTVKIDGVAIPSSNISSYNGNAYHSCAIGTQTAGVHSYSIESTNRKGLTSVMTGSFTVVAPLTVAASATPKGSAASLTDVQLAAVAADALSRMEAELGSQVATAMAGVEIKVANLSAGTLGETSGKTIWIDNDAAGYGWFVDSTPLDDAEFTQLASNSLSARSGSAADQRADLLTAVMHEMGHVLGNEHVADGLMSATLPLGARRVK